MYDETDNKIELTADEVDLLKDILLYRLSYCVSLSEELTVKNLLDKLEAI